MRVAFACDKDTHHHYNKRVYITRTVYASPCNAFFRTYVAVGWSLATWQPWCRVINVKNQLLQNDLLTAVICWTNFHQNTAVVTVNSIASLGWKSIEIPEKYKIMCCNYRKPWSLITILHSNLSLWVYHHQKVLVVWLV